LSLSPVPSDSAALLGGDAGMASALGDEIGSVLGDYLDGMLAGSARSTPGQAGRRDGGRGDGGGAAIAGISGEEDRRRKGEGEAVRGRRGLGAPSGELAGATPRPSRAPPNSLTDPSPGSAADPPS
ncbi:hypothetical protein THAOC_22128, partial [Thalassiosira oceanica]